MDTSQRFGVREPGPGVVRDVGAALWLHSVMTELRRCRWCRRVLPDRTGRGRRREFCSQRCRQWDWVARQRAHELELSDGELVIAKAALDELRDELYVLACAVDDVERDLEAAGATPSALELTQALEWLLAAARPLRDREIAAPPPSPSITS